MSEQVERWPMTLDYIPSKKRLPVGACFSWHDKTYQRMPGGIIKRRRGNDPTILRAYIKREKRRQARTLRYYQLAALRNEGQPGGDE